MNIQPAGNINFKSGLTPAILKRYRKASIENIADTFAKEGVKTDFENNKTAAFNCMLVRNIFREMAEKYKLPVNFIPQTINIFHEKKFPELSNCIGFHIFDNLEMNNKTYPAGSIFLNDAFKNIFYTDFYATRKWLSGKYSTPSFFHTEMHEWLHDIHTHLIYSKYGYDGNDAVFKQKYGDKLSPALFFIMDNTHKIEMDLSPKEKIYVRKRIGQYAEKDCMWDEIFAELMSKLISKSLDRNLNLKKNPLDNIPKDLPKKIRTNLEETLNI